ncbi:FGGY-family carbohydrate kinase [Verminephrobacter eiseniae]|uniref:FGGY-family carbohydrate kinase n=1 Tax=Verminephrobacter eiseniae TaxID=364317 RepID=UPI00223742E7|nr:FGGY-family carbohydrate kinase [Verminephrobacter eiseniae]MCW5237308.1 sugar kinase [Verminephrobacter eiseniae]
MAVVMGLDFGTGSVRAGLYDTSSGALIGVEDARYGTSHPRLGWAEQAPLDWWEALGQASQAVMARHGHPRVSALCACTTSSTVVVTDEAGMPLRPALLWMDCRASHEVTLAPAMPHPVMAFSGGANAVEWLVPKAAWLARNEPQVYARAHRICEAQDFINFKLTGTWAASRLNACCKWNYDTLEKKFYPDLFAALGAPGLLDKLPTRVVPVGEAVGSMSTQAKAHLGLQGHVLVAQGGIDAHMAMLGAGTIEPGKLLFIGGTSIVHLIHTERRIDAPGMWGPYPDALIDNSWLIEGGQVSAGSVMDWLACKIFGLDAAGHRHLIADAAREVPGASGLLVLDYWMGNRTPYRSPDLRGAMMGLTLSHDRAQIYRAAVDAVALGSANVVRVLTSFGAPVTRVVAAGGIQKNPLWLQATVDACGLPFDVTDQENLTLMGAAVAALNALGESVDLVAGVKNHVAPYRRRYPDPAMHERYAAMLLRYRAATEAVQPLSHELVRSAA